MLLGKILTASGFQRGAQSYGKCWLSKTCYRLFQRSGGEDVSEDMPKLFSFLHSFSYSCFSRYVQHKIREQSALLYDLIKTKSGIFMVAGNSKNMPNSVKEALQIALGVDHTYIDEMIKQGRYQEETWN